MNRKNLIVLGAIVAGGILALGCSAGGEGANPPAPSVWNPSASVPSDKPMQTGAQQADNTPFIIDGQWTVGEDFPAGTYQVEVALGEGSGCYWEINKTGTNGTEIIANDVFVKGKPKVTLTVGQDFKTDDCGRWVKVG